MTRQTVYEYDGAGPGFKDLRILREEGTSFVSLYYDTPQASAYGNVMEVDDAIEFIERMRRVIGYPWTSPPAAEAIEALEQLKQQLAQPAAPVADDNDLPARWAQAG